MMASHWVLEDIAKDLHGKDCKGKEKIFRDFIRKYPDDDEVVGLLREYLKGKDSGTLAKIRKRLQVLAKERKIEGSSGGSQLWFGDRRSREGQKTR